MRTALPLYTTAHLLIHRRCLIGVCKRGKLCLNLLYMHLSRVLGTPYCISPAQARAAPLSSRTSIEYRVRVFTLLGVLALGRPLSKSLNPPSLPPEGPPKATGGPSFQGPEGPRLLPCFSKNIVTLYGGNIWKGCTHSSESSLYMFVNPFSVTPSPLPSAHGCVR